MPDVDQEKLELFRRVQLLEKEVKQLKDEFQQFRIQNYDIVAGKSECREALIKFNNFDHRITLLENTLAEE